MRAHATSALATAAAAALLLAPAPAVAGAPNYDCVAGDGARLAIDQWADVVAARGFDPGPTVWGRVQRADQDGGSLDVVARLRDASWIIAVRGTRASLVIESPSETLRGECAFVPGNYVLRAADAGGAVLRAGPSAHAQRLLAIPRGTAVWQIPDQAVRRGWMGIRVFVVRADEIRAVDGWLRQRDPLVPRYPG